jgi:acyl carrier protein
MHSELKNRLANILKNHFLVETSILRSWKYLEDLGITQPEKRELFNLFEDEFHIQISETDEKKIRTVRDTVSIIQQNLGHESLLKTA